MARKKASHTSYYHPRSPSAEDVALARMDREEEDKTTACADFLDKISTSKGKKRTKRKKSMPVQNLTLLGVFSPEAFELAKNAIVKTVERANKNDEPSDAAERNYLNAAKTIIEYEIGKPRQAIELAGKDGGPLQVVLLPDVQSYNDGPEEDDASGD